MIAYVTTMKRGLPAFVYREVDQLTASGTKVAIFTTKYAPGLYMPKPDWPFTRLNPPTIVARQPWHFLQDPARYLQMLNLALKSKSVADFVIGADYAARMARMQVTAVHCVEGLHALAIGYYCHRFLGLPLSVTVHADALYMVDEWPIIPLALQACRFVTTVCEFNRHILIEKFGLPAERVQVVRLFVDPHHFAPDPSIKILIVGQFSQRKGHETLLRAVKKLDPDRFRVWVVGEGTWGSVGDYVDVRQLARQLNVADRVTFFGSVSEETLRVLYQNCDIFCLPSRKYVVNEGLPVSLMEAMSCEKPVISTRHAGIPELVPDMLIEEDDDAGLSRAIMFLADHPNLRREVGQRNRTIVARDYAPSNVGHMVKLFSSGVQTSSKGEVTDDESADNRRRGLHRILSDH